MYSLQRFSPILWAALLHPIVSLTVENILFYQVHSVSSGANGVLFSQSYIQNDVGYCLCFPVAATVIQV